MADNQMSLPGSGIGGIMRYDAEYQSRIMISPKAVIVFIAAILVFVVLIRILFPVTL